MYTGLPTHRRPKYASVQGTGDSDGSPPYNLRTRKKTDIYMYMGGSLGVVTTHPQWVCMSSDVNYKHTNSLLP